MSLSIQKPTPYTMSSLVVVRYLKLPIQLLNDVGSTILPPLSLVNFKPVDLGIIITLHQYITYILRKEDKNVPFILYEGLDDSTFE